MLCLEGYESQLTTTGVGVLDFWEKKGSPILLKLSVLETMGSFSKKHGIPGQHCWFGTIVNFSGQLETVQ